MLRDPEVGRCWPLAVLQLHVVGDSVTIVVITMSPATLSRVSQGWTQYKTRTLKLKFGRLQVNSPSEVILA